MRIDNLYGTIKLARNNIIGADQLITVIFNEQVNGVVRVEGNEKINFIRVMQYLITFKRHQSPDESHAYNIHVDIAIAN